MSKVFISDEMLIDIMCKACVVRLGKKCIHWKDCKFSVKQTGYEVQTEKTALEEAREFKIVITQLENGSQVVDYPSYLKLQNLYEKAIEEQQKNN